VPHPQQQLIYQQMMPLSVANTQAEIDALVGKGYTLDQAVAATELQRLSTSDSVRIGVRCLFELY
jgi:hypothetical protein